MVTIGNITNNKGETTMAIIKVHKTKNYTTISNYHLKEKEMSLKAKGLLSLMLSLPEDWDYSVLGLTKICCESKNTINDILQELEKFGYLHRERIYENGKIIDWEYEIFEQSYLLHPKNEDIENQDIENCDLEQQNNLKTNTLNNIKENNIKEKKFKEPKYKYGEYSNVALTDKELEKLKADYGEEETKEAIKYLDEYIEMRGTVYKSHYLVIKKWVFTAVKEQAIREERANAKAPKKLVKERKYTTEELNSFYTNIDEIKFD